MAERLINSACRTFSGLSDFPGPYRAATSSDVAAWSIRREIAEITDATVAERIRIQYGGGVKPANAAVLLHEPDIDGALVGGASLDPRDFAEIVKAARTSRD